MPASPLPRAFATMPESKQVLVERIFGEHLSALRAFFFRRVRTEPQAADLVQGVYVRMLQINDISAIRDPQAYLFTVARNLAHPRRSGARPSSQVSGKGWRSAR